MLTLLTAILNGVNDNGIEGHYGFDVVRLRSYRRNILLQLETCHDEGLLSPYLRNNLRHTSDAICGADQDGAHDSGTRQGTAPGHKREHPDKHSAAH
jgi:hypothetical protein